MKRATKTIHNSGFERSRANLYRVLNQTATKAVPDLKTVLSDVGCDVDELSAYLDRGDTTAVMAWAGELLAAIEGAPLEWEKKPAPAVTKQRSIFGIWG